MSGHEHTDQNKMGLVALALMIFTSVYGFANIPLSYFNMGYSAIPYFVIAAILYFIPFSLMIAEMAQAFKDSHGGIYTWMERCVGIKWAFTGIFMWWISYVVWMVGKATNMWIPLSFGLFGRNIFTDANVMAWTGLRASQFFGIIGICFMIFTTSVAIKGIKGVAKVASIGGMAVIALNILLFLGGVIVLLSNGLTLGETNFAMFQSPNEKFGTPVAGLGFLVYALFAFGGMEACGGLVDTVKDKKSYIGGLAFAGAIISVGYALGVFFVGTFTNWAEVMGAKDVNGEALVNYATVTYVVVGQLGLTLGKVFHMSNPEILKELFARFAGIGMFLAYVGAFFTLVYAPLKQMIDGTPEELWPLGMGADDEVTKTPKKALLVQGAFVVIMIALVAFGGKGAAKFFATLQGMTNIAMTLPYIFISYAYIKFLNNDSIEKPFQVLSKNKGFGILGGWVVTLVVAFGNVFSVMDLDAADGGILGMNIPGVYDEFIVGPIIFAIISYLIVHNYERKNKAE
ncbi:MAG: glutamate/gamma-aminobutyrate family transporter YjeM [Fusobacteriaceae bacterium]|nr:glutamate/gamma-aminobutyrate family transporter YjeM [Fusobacteriaceae bacterium]